MCLTADVVLFHPVEAINDELKTYGQANPELTQTQLTQTMITPKDSKYPILKAKAAQARHLVGFVRLLAYRQAGHLGRPPMVLRGAMAGRSANYTNLVVTLCDALKAYFDAINAEPFDKEVCRRSILVILRTHNRLNRMWRWMAGRKPFHRRQKMHMLLHLAFEQLDRFGNPKDYWCYRDEDFVGALKQICAKSKHPRSIEKVVMKKARLLSAVLARK